MQPMERLRRAITASGLDAAILMPGPNLHYASGISFHTSERPILAIIPAHGIPAVVLPAFEAGRVEAAAVEMVPYAYRDEEGPRGAIQSACAALELADSMLGVEALRLRLLEARLLERYAPGCRLVAAEQTLYQMRMCKTDRELDHMRAAASVADEALGSTMSQVRVGMTEAQVARMLALELLRAGGEALAFAPIVLAGPNAALPHASSSDRPIARGETIVVDCGVTMNGYASDITRTFIIGEAEPDLAWVHEVVVMANAAATAAARADTPAEVVDQTARAVIEEAGYGRHFTHRTGHGLGLETHEPPYIVAGNRQPLSPGMTFTIEPGIYLPGRGGVRIEDDVTITGSGAEALTSYPRHLHVL